MKVSYIMVGYVWIYDQSTEEVNLKFESLSFLKQNEDRCRNVGTC